MGRRKRVRKFVKYFVLLASQFSDQNRFCLHLCESVLTGFVQTFPFFNSKTDYPQNSPHLQVLHLLQASGAAPSSLGTHAGVSRCAPQPSANGEGDGEGDVPGRFSLPFAFFPPCANTFPESRRRWKWRKTELPGCVPRGSRPAARLCLGEGRFCRAERRPEAAPCLGSVRGSGRGARLHRQDMSSFSASVVDLESAESEVGKSQKRTHIIIFFLSVFDVLVCSLAALWTFDRNLWMIFRRLLLKDWLSS